MLNKKYTHIEIAYDKLNMLLFITCVLLSVTKEIRYYIGTFKNRNVKKEIQKIYFYLKIKIKLLKLLLL